MTTEDSGRRRRKIEREFGVPIAGEILPPQQWTQTALKTIPLGELDWPALFGRSAPRILELGCGNGRFLLASAYWRRDCDHIGIDALPLVLRYATRRANQRGLSNLRFAAYDNCQFLEQCVAPGSLAEIHCYHPQPYYRREEYRQRLWSPRFLHLVHRALPPDGRLFLQTDHPAYWKYLLSIIGSVFLFEERSVPWPDAPKGRTRREILALKHGLTIFRGVATPISGLSAAILAERIAELPLPLFDADRSLEHLDHLESTP